MDAQYTQMIQKNTVSMLIMTVLSLSLSVVISAQSTDTLIRFASTAGMINSSTPAQSWSFTALANEVISIYVEADDTSFDPILEIIDGDGQVIISNDDYDYPNSRNALLEAITLPRTATYEAVVRGYLDSAGNYTITLTEGYTDIILRENFNDEGNWVTTNDIESEFSDGSLRLATEGVQVGGFTYDVSADDVDTFYTQVDVTEITGRDGWTVGLTLRTSLSRYYLLTINARGQWRFLDVEKDEFRVVRDLNQHPAIVPGETRFTLGVLANQAGFDIFYNGQLMGQVVDTALDASGQVGIFVETANAVGAQMSATFDNLMITTPHSVNNDTVFPEQIILGTPAQIAQELERRLVIRPGGNLRFDVDESFIDSTRPGALLQSLASDSTFTNMIIGTTTNIVQNAGSELAGCGIVARYVDDSDYMVAYIDTESGFGVSTRANDQFTDGTFNQNADLINQDERNTLTLILLDTALYFYVNGQFVGDVDIRPQAGGVGNALLNFEAINTTCQFSNTWLWSLDQ